MAEAAHAARGPQTGGQAPRPGPGRTFSPSCSEVTGWKPRGTLCAPRRARNHRGSRGGQGRGGTKAAGSAVNMVQEEALGRAMTRLTSQGSASLVPEENMNMQHLLAQDDHPPAIPSTSWSLFRTLGERGARLQTFTDRVRRAVVAFKLVCEPMLADHVAMEALGRFANLVETPKMSEMQQETMACTNLVAATSGTKKKVATTANGNSAATLGGIDGGGTRHRKPCNKQW